MIWRIVLSLTTPDWLLWARVFRFCLCHEKNTDHTPHPQLHIIYKKKWSCELLTCCDKLIRKFIVQFFIGRIWNRAEYYDRSSEPSWCGREKEKHMYINMSSFLTKMTYIKNKITIIQILLLFKIYIYLFIPKTFQCIFKQNCVLGKALHDGHTFPQHHSLVGWEACSDGCSAQILSALAKVFFLGCSLTSQPPEVSSVIGSAFLCALNICHLLRSDRIQINKMITQTPNK